MKSVWQVQEAKNRLSEVIESAISQGPQIVTHHGKAVVKIIALSPREIDAAGDDDGFCDHLMKAPKVGELKLPKRKSRKRPIDLGA
jgi:antitoxin Phd